MNSFSELGIVCSVVSPADTATIVMNLADIVIVDWYLQDSEPQFALKLLREFIVGVENQNSLRLVAIYTGVQDLGEIRETIF